jgi:glycosyltransferase involved in cell wall biosynthesis
VLEKNRKIKVAFLGNQISPGGGSTSLLLMLKSLKDYDFKKYVFVSTCKSNEMKNNFSKYCEAVEVIDLDEIVSCQTLNTPFYKFILHRIRSKKKTLKFVEKLNHLDIDILHINNSVFAHTLKWIKEKSRVKVVYHIREKIDHSGIHLLQKYIIKNIVHYSDKIVAISDNEAKIFSHLSDVDIIANPFDFDVINKVKVSTDIDKEVEEDTILIGMLGRFDRVKGHIDFLKATKLILSKFDKQFKLKFALVGVNPPKPLWKRIIKKMLFRRDFYTDVKHFILKYNLESFVIMIPYTKNVLNIINRIDIIIRPSLTGDPWGRDIIESMAFRKPIVATGTSEFYIKNNKTGFLVTPGKSEELSEKICKLIIDKDLRRDFGEKGFSIIQEMCDIKKYGEKIIMVYKKLI